MDMHVVKMDMYVVKMDMYVVKMDKIHSNSTIKVVVL